VEKKKKMISYPSYSGLYSSICTLENQNKCKIWLILFSYKLPIPENRKSLPVKCITNLILNTDEKECDLLTCGFDIVKGCGHF
jgi:hypothetical protein